MYRASDRLPTRLNAADFRPMIVAAGDSAATSDRVGERGTEQAPHLISSSTGIVQEPECPDCQGTGWYLQAVPFGHPDFGRLFACRCKEIELSARRTAELARLSNLAAFQDKTFASFSLVPGVLQAYRSAESFARRQRGWLTLIGPCGCGKTHLAAAIANAVLDQGQSVLFVVVPDLLDDLRRTFAAGSDASYDQRFDLVKSAALLVLDDLGSESATAWARETLYQLVNYRYNQALPTIVTTNVRPERLDPRIASRMHDPALPSEIVIIQAADYRHTARDGSRSGFCASTKA